MMTKTRVRMRLRKLTEGMAYFVAGVDDDTADDRQMQLSHEMWDEMGRPEQVTVSIEPGDQLTPPSDMEEQA